MSFRCLCKRLIVAAAWVVIALPAMPSMAACAMADAPVPVAQPSAVDAGAAADCRHQDQNSSPSPVCQHCGDACAQSAAAIVHTSGGSAADGVAWHDAVSPGLTSTPAPILLRPPRLA